MAITLRKLQPTDVQKSWAKLTDTANGIKTSRLEQCTITFVVGRQKDYCICQVTSLKLPIMILLAKHLVDEL